MLNPANAPGFLIRRLQQISIQIFAEVTKGAKLSTIQYGALQVIEQRPEIDQVSLSQLLDTDRTTIARLVDRLFQSGLIVRKSNPNDRRSNCLSITPRGVAQLRKTEPCADTSQQQLLSPLSSAERTEFMRLLRKLVFAHADRRFGVADDGDSSVPKGRKRVA